MLISQSPQQFLKETKTIATVVAKYDFSEENVPYDQHTKTFLQFKAHDTIVVVRESKNPDTRSRQWLKGYKQDAPGQQGWFPSTYVTFMETLGGQLNASLFGRPLIEVVLQENRCVPWFVEYAVGALLENKQEGVLRNAGDQQVLAELESEIVKSPKYQFQDPDKHRGKVNEIGTLLKRFVKELPDPLIPIQCEQKIIKLITVNDGKQQTTKKARDIGCGKLCRSLVEGTSFESFLLIRFLLKFSSDFLKFQSITQIGITQLTQMFGQQFFDRAKQDQSDNRYSIFQVLVELQQKLEEYYLEKLTMVLPHPGDDVEKVQWKTLFLSFKKSREAVVCRDFVAPLYLRKCMSVKIDWQVKVQEVVYSWALCEYQPKEDSVPIRGWVPISCLNLNEHQIDVTY